MSYRQQQEQQEQQEAEEELKAKQMMHRQEQKYELLQENNCVEIRFNQGTSNCPIKGSIEDEKSGIRCDEPTL